ncbi:hypothetical protein CCR75_004894 [Bremia lactucae]|uniref:Uncharacterized protein n=1 Tax=Bremia lactucae TaxID=4779 RepID=A0A976FFU6_BRELC|nr:hypothetical protein CCR75_004894 [Bremia lactucae]
MPLLSFEGVAVDLPLDLAGLEFQFTAGSLTIHCNNFTGDIVLQKQTSTSSKAASPSTKRTTDHSASDERIDVNNAKRQRPNFLNEAEQTLLLAQLHKPQSTESNPMTRHNSTAEPEAEDKTEIKLANDPIKAASINPFAKKTSRTKKTQDKTEDLLSPGQKQLLSRQTTLDADYKSTIKTVNTMPQPAVHVRYEPVETLGSTPPERWGHSVTKISNERVVVYGGTDDEERTLGDLYVFDMKTHRWTTPLNCETITRTWHDAVYLASKNLVLVFGGERSAAVDSELDILSDIMVLDTECFLWYPPAIHGTPPSARSGHTCTAVGHEVVVFGGTRGRSRQSSVHILDTNLWHWKAVKVDGNPPSARTYHSAVALGEDRIVYFGGNDSSKSFHAVHVLQKVPKKKNGAVWTWVYPNVTGVPPQERTGHSATLLKDGNLFVFGGWDPQRGDVNAPTSVFDDAFILDTKTWEWQPVPFNDGRITSRGRVGHGAVLDCNEKLYLFGGQNGQEERLQDVCTLTLLKQDSMVE